jgi:hypothetical protein
MSHCTRFEFTYKDELTAVRAFQRLGLRPQTTIVSWYSSDLLKKTAGALGIVGDAPTRAIMAARPPYNYLLVHHEGTMSLMIESRDSSAIANQQAIRTLEENFRLQYIEVVIEEQLGGPFSDAGVPWRLSRNADALELQFGPDYRRQISFRLVDGQLQEEVFGVTGASCEKLTSALEAALAAPSAELITEWKPAYHEIVEDEVVQILRLE